jgi:hypothetical protein
MKRLSPISYGTAPASLKAGLDEELRLRGRLTNLKLIQARSPVALRVYGEWFALKEALNAKLTDRAVFIFSLAIAEAQRSSIPIGFFRRALSKSGLDPDNLDLSSEERLLREFGNVLGRDSNAVTDELWLELAEIYDETLLVDLVAFAGIMVATTVFANIVKADPDDDLLAYLKPSA